MATKKSRTNDDDDFDEDEEEERPRKRKPARKEDDKAEDRSRKKSKARDDDVKVTAGAKKRKSRAEEEEEDEEEEEKEEKPRKKKKPEKEEEDEEDDGDEDEDPYEAWIRKQADKRKSLLVGEEALAMFGKRAMTHAYSFLGFVGFGLAASVTFRFNLLDPEMSMWLVYLCLGETLTMGFGVPLMGLAAIAKAKKSPAKMQSGMLHLGMIGNCVAMGLYVLSGLSLFLSSNIYIDLGIMAVWWAALNSTFIADLLWFQCACSFLKDKQTVVFCKNGILHFVIVAYIGVPVLIAACYFLSFMGMLGQALSAVVSLVWVSMYVKGLFDVTALAKALGLGCTKKIAAMDKPEW